METRNLDNNNLTRFPFDAFFQGVRRLFVFAFDNNDNGAKEVERNSHTKYFLPRVEITNYSVLVDYQCFKYHYKLIAVDLSKRRGPNSTDWVLWDVKN